MRQIDFLRDEREIKDTEPDMNSDTNSDSNKTTVDKPTPQGSVCSICFENATETIPCGHHFHAECIKPWLKYNSCPVCRAVIDKTKPVMKPVSDASDDGQLALNLNNHGNNNRLVDMHNMILNLMEAAMFISNMNRYIEENAEEKGTEEKKGMRVIAVNIPLKECANCHDSIHIDPFCCSVCGDYYYCSLECEENHRPVHGCPQDLSFFENDVKTAN